MTDQETIDALRRESASMVAAIRNRSPLRLSSEFELLIQQAAQTHGTPDDIAAWARRLAEDVRDLPDAAEGRQGLVDSLSSNASNCDRAERAETELATCRAQHQALLDRLEGLEAAWHDRPLRGLAGRALRDCAQQLAAARKEQG